MKRIILVTACVSLVMMLLIGCGGNIPLEDLTISLILGIDLDEDNHIVISESSPVFNKDAKKNVENIETKAQSIRESRKYFDAMTMGKVTSAKIQVLLIGKKLLSMRIGFQSWIRCTATRLFPSIQESLSSMVRFLTLFFLKRKINRSCLCF